MKDLNNFKNEMNLSGKNVYVGHRYVPKIMGDWDNTQIYEPLSIVQYQGNSFTSRQYVPSGVELSNEEYWASTGNYNAQIEQYRQDVRNLESDVNNVTDEVVNARNGETTLSTRLDKDKQEVNTQLAAIEVNVKDFGAKGDGVTDDTKSIQSALDFVGSFNGLGSVKFDDGVFMIESTGDGVYWQGKGIMPKSNTRLILSDNTILKTIPNDKSNGKMINLTDVENVHITGGAIEGDRNEHLGTAGEWGRNISISGAKDIFIDNILLRDSWGDGITVDKSTLKNHSENIVIKNVLSENNRRQGMSVISVNGLYVYDSEFNLTNGTAPESGIDFEPNDDDSLMDNIYISNAKFKGNNGKGIDFAFNTLSSKKNMNITIDNPVFENTGIGFSSGGNTGLPTYLGMITINHPVFKKTNFCQVNFWNWHDNMPTVLIDKPEFIIDEHFNYIYGDASCLVNMYRRDETPYIKNTGNFIIKNLICVKTPDATVLPLRIFQSHTPSGTLDPTPINNVKIIDPLDVTGLQNATVNFGSNVGTGCLFLDGNDICSYKAKETNNVIGQNLAPTITDDTNDVSNRNLYLSLIPVGQTIKISKLYDSQGRLTVRLPEEGNFIQNVTKQVSVGVGESVTIKRLSETSFTILKDTRKNIQAGELSVTYVDNYWLQARIDTQFDIVTVAFIEDSKISSEAEGLTLSVTKVDGYWFVKVRSLDGSFQETDEIKVNYIGFNYL